ncbi:MAG: IS256 family transposase [Candidatus Marinimicrobia bacterium]|nr:IS256 family transposase [Candidatus Neomarinimicrobiota bacterium]MBL7047096.1 IS256 family transposase [Candidatus Neomarinimicrobiota bacterium]
MNTNRTGYKNINSELTEIFGVDITPSIISNLSDEIVSEVKTWQSRPLDSIYPLVYLGVIKVKTHSDNHIENTPVYLAIGINMDGVKDILGLWITKTEGTRFWRSVLMELKNRGLKDCFIVSVCNLKGFPSVLKTVYPSAKIHLCVAHIIRHSLRYISGKQRRDMLIDLQKVYKAGTEEEAQEKLVHFAEKWDVNHPTVSKYWRDNWDYLAPFFDYPEEVRFITFRINTILHGQVESLNLSLNTITEALGPLPVNKVVPILSLALKNANKKWTMPIQNWKEAMNHFAILFEDRMAQNN